MLSNLMRSFAIRQSKSLISEARYSFSYRKNQQAQIQRSHKDFFDHSNQKVFRAGPKDLDKQLWKKNQNQTNVEEYVKTINEINKEFLGIKLNTDYFKVHNQKSFEQICKPQKSQTYKVNDLPFSVKPLKQKNQNKQVLTTLSQKLPNNTAAKMLISMISQQKLLKELQRLSKKYFSDLLYKQRNSRMEVNFQAEARRVVQTLKARKWSFKLSNKDTNPNVVLRNVTILKGVQVNRNNNYTVDSYKIDFDEAQQGIITYTLFKKARENYPEAEWFAQKYIVARIEAEVSDCPIVDVTEDNQVQTSSKGLTHSFVFQADLTVPPQLSILSLAPEQQLKSYRLKSENICITNVDKKNIWFKLAYNQDQKKFKLINKIV